MFAFFESTLRNCPRHQLERPSRKSQDDSEHPSSSIIDHYHATDRCEVHLRLRSSCLPKNRSRDSFEVPSAVSLAMSEQLSPAERYDLATQLITQSPPGQVNDVIAGKSPSCHGFHLKFADERLSVYLQPFKSSLMTTRTSSRSRSC